MRNVERVNERFFIADKLAAAKRAADQEMNASKPILKPVTPQAT